MCVAKNPLTIDEATFSQILGSSKLSPVAAQRLRNTNTEYRPLTPEERDGHILRVLHRVEAPNARRSTEENIQAFETGWSENLELCRKNGLSRENLRPRYVRPYPCIRFQSDYIAPTNPFLAYDLLGVAVSEGFVRYFSDIESVCEFGCGTGQYLYEASQIYPELTLIGTDWTEASVGILALMAQQGIKISGQRFDMLQPNHSFKLPQHSAILTVGALEQLGPNFQLFLDYMIEQRPSIALHYEPIEDFYDPTQLVDYLGLRYHQCRGYLTGFLPALQKLETAGAIDILEARRMPFGDPFHESGSLIAWRPKRD